MGAEVVGDKYTEIINNFLIDKFEGGRYQRRLEKIEAVKG